MGKDSAKNRRKEKVAARDGLYGCYLCGYTVRSKLTLHHKKKQSDGGSHDLDNLCILCEDCHTAWHWIEPKAKDLDFEKWVEFTRKYLIRIVSDL